MGRRTETTEFLAECIADALIELMKKTPIEKVKIQDITDRAKVGRMTYFRYFTSKEDVLLYKMTLLGKRWAVEHPFPYESDRHDQALWFFSFCNSIQEFLSVLFRQNQFNVLFNIFQVEPVPMKTEFGKPHYHNLFVTYGALGVVTGWLQSECKETPEELADICTV